MVADLSQAVALLDAGRLQRLRQPKTQRFVAGRRDAIDANESREQVDQIKRRQFAGRQMLMLQRRLDELAKVLGR
jgi:hypothetical protein